MRIRAIIFSNKTFKSKFNDEAQKKDAIIVNKEIEINEGVWGCLISSRIFYACTISMEAKVRNRSIKRTQILIAIQIDISRKFTLIYL